MGADSKGRWTSGNCNTRQTRLKWLAEATRQGDGRTLAALSEAPEYVTGIDRETLEKHLLSAEQTHAPDLFERLQQFESDREALQAALTQADRIAARTVDLETIQAARAADDAEAELARQTA